MKQFLFEICLVVCLTVNMTTKHKIWNRLTIGKGVNRKHAKIYDRSLKGLVGTLDTDHSSTPIRPGLTQYYTSHHRLRTLVPGVSRSSNLVLELGRRF